jgi:class I fructose-bisphosphate aldolase
MNTEIEKLLDDSAKSLLEHQCKTVPREKLHLPGPDFVSRVYAETDRSARVLGSLQTLFNHGRLAGTGYLSILPIRASSIQRARALRRTRNTLIPKTS